MLAFNLLKDSVYYAYQVFERVNIMSIKAINAIFVLFRIIVWWNFWSIIFITNRQCAWAKEAKRKFRKDKIKIKMLTDQIRRRAKKCYINNRRYWLKHRDTMPTYTEFIKANLKHIKTLFGMCRFYLIVTNKQKQTNRSHFIFV